MLKFEAMPNIHLISEDLLARRGRDRVRGPAPSLIETQKISVLLRRVRIFVLLHISLGFELLLSKCLLDGLGELGNDLVEVTYDTVVCYVEDGSILILVDSDDDV